jgi:hypothetical protein
LHNELVGSHVLPGGQSAVVPQPQAEPTIAAPRLRVAIEHVAEGRPDAELEEALAQMEGGGDEKQSR